MNFNPLRDPCFTCRLWQGKDSPCIRPKTYHKGALTFIGEAPGEQEDRKDEAFVGPAGQILRECLASLGHTKFNLLNAVKCRPTKDGKNRPPTAKEVKLCNEFLWEEIELICPSVIVCLGRVAAGACGLPEVPLRDLRNRRWMVGETPVFVTYHPAYSLKPGMAHIKQEFTNDLKLYLSDLKPDIDKVGEVGYTVPTMVKEGVTDLFDKWELEGDEPVLVRPRRNESIGQVGGVSTETSPTCASGGAPSLVEGTRGKEITIDIETSGFFKDHEAMPFDGKGEILLIGVDGEHITD